MNRRSTILFLFALNLTLSCHNTRKQDDVRHSRGAGVSGGDMGCGVEDGRQQATVYYYNPSTGYNVAYTLTVEVEDCQVVQIDFDNGGYLNEDHIRPADIDANGNASVEDDRGRSFEVHISK